MALSRPRSSVKDEVASVSGVKAERRVKAEVVRSAFTTSLEAKVKGEAKAPATKSEVRVKGEAKGGAAGVKAELLKQEAKLKVEATSGVSALIERGLQLRAMAARVKEEKKPKIKKGLKRVKKEPGKGRKTKGAKRGVRRRCSLARRNASREAISRPVALSPELAELVGAGTLARPEVLKRVWAHCRERGLLNPADKREALFDERLQALFGKPSARLFELYSLLVPHLDYTSQGAEAAAAASGIKPGLEAKRQPKGESARSSKIETPGGAKHEATSSSKCEPSGGGAKREARCEAPSRAKREAPHTVETPSPAAGKRERTQDGQQQEQQPPQPKRERLHSAPPGAAPGALAAAVRSVVPRFSKIGRSSAVVEFQAPPGDLRLEAVAVPLGARGGEAAGEAVRRACEVEFREGADGALEPCAEVRFEGLEPAVAYRVSIDAVISSADGAAEEVPEFVRRVREYRIDGATLLALGEEDLRALGLVAPFLLRRVTAALQELRSG